MSVKPADLLKLLWEGASPPGGPTCMNVKAIVQEYTGKVPVKVEWVPDPKVPGCTAVRATFARKRVLDLIVYHHDAGYDIEEVAFKSWPPRSI